MKSFHEKEVVQSDEQEENPADSSSVIYTGTTPPPDGGGLLEDLSIQMERSTSISQSGTGERTTSSLGASSQDNSMETNKPADQPPWWSHTRERDYTVPSKQEVRDRKEYWEAAKELKKDSHFKVSWETREHRVARRAAASGTLAQCLFPGSGMYPQDIPEAPSGNPTPAQWTEDIVPLVDHVLNVMLKRAREPRTYPGSQ